MKVGRGEGKLDREKEKSGGGRKKTGLERRK